MSIETDRRRHDAILKKVFEYPEMVSQFFKQHLPEDVQQIIDITTLAAVSENFADESLSISACDILFYAKCKDEQDGYLYLMLEGQSTNDPFMAFRLLQYITKIVAAHITKYGEKEKLPFVYPLVFWQNDYNYTAKRNVWDLFNYPDLARKYLAGEHALINVQKIADSDLAQNHWTGLFQLVTKYIRRPNLLAKIDEFGQLITKLSNEASGNNFLQNILCYVLTAVKENDKIKLAQILNNNTNDGNEIMGSLAQSFIDQGITQGINQGINIGEARGKAEGINIGEARGKVEEKYYIAKKLLLKQVSIKEIADITDLSISQIKAIAAKL
jgi:predicted transposase/invertase (TIGR01784 family)